MSIRALLAVMLFFACGLSAPAQELQSPELMQPVRLGFDPVVAGGGAPSALDQARLFGALNTAWYGPAALTLADGRLFSFPSAFAWMEAPAPDFIPAALLAEPVRVAPAAAFVQNSTGTPVNLLPRVDYIGGEVGGFYGRSTGKNGLEVKGGYIQSEIIEGNTYINFGASYEESSGRLPRFGR